MQTIVRDLVSVITVMFSFICRRTSTMTTTAFVAVNRSPSSVSSLSVRCRRGFPHPGRADGISLLSSSSSSMMMIQMRGGSSDTKSGGSSIFAAVAETEEVLVSVVDDDDDDSTTMTTTTTAKVSTRSLYQELLTKLERITHLGELL